MEEKNLICICCPLGCPLTVTLENGEVVSVTGNTCPRGAAYGRREVTNPTRIVTSTALVSGGVLPVVSVKTASDIPKGKIKDVMEAIILELFAMNWKLISARRGRYGCGYRRHQKYSGCHRFQGELIRNAYR